MSFKTSFWLGVALVVVIYTLGAIGSFSSLQSAIRFLLFNQGVEAVCGILLLVSLLIAVFRDSEFSRDRAGFIAGLVVFGYVVGFFLAV